MKRTFVIVVIAAALIAMAAFAFAEDAKAPVSFDKAQAPGVKATCPVMGAEFTIDAKTTFSQYDGKYYYFCCSGCKASFDKDPAKYAAKK
jgi:YHS domain-containing protein